MVDELRGLFARTLAHRFQNTRLGDPPEIVADRGPPADLDHVEIRRARQPVGLGEPHVQRVLRDAVAAIGVRLLVKRVDAIADAMSEQCHAARVVEPGQPVPQRLVVGGDVASPGLAALLHRAGRRAVLQPFILHGKKI